MKRCARAGWPLERVLFAMAGTVTLLSAALAATVSPWFLRLLGKWAWYLPKPLDGVLPDVRFGHA